MNTDPIPTAILVRVSTDAQDNARQIHELEAVAAKNGWEVIEVVEEHVSGNAHSRPGLERVLELARCRDIEKVLVHEVSRIARRNSIAHRFIEDLCEFGVSCYWHSQAIETLLPDGRRNPAAAIMFSLLSEMARAERETLVERIKSGLAEARRKGKHLGRPFGACLTQAALLEKHPAVVRHLHDGKSIRVTALVTGRSTGTVEKIRRAMGLTVPKAMGKEYEV